MDFTIYENITGRVLQTGNCADTDINLQLVPDNHSIILKKINNLDYYFFEEKLVAMPLKPDSYFVFNYSTRQWEDLRTLNQKWNIVRQKRDGLIGFCDWTQLSDVPLTDKQAWTTYRQALRDITLQPDPLNIIWPTPPQG